jgi:hypothetical protein
LFRLFVLYRYRQETCLKTFLNFELFTSGLLHLLHPARGERVRGRLRPQEEERQAGPHRPRLRRRRLHKVQVQYSFIGITLGPVRTEYINRVITICECLA